MFWILIIGALLVWLGRNQNQQQSTTPNQNNGDMKLLLWLVTSPIWLGVLAVIFIFIFLTMGG